MTMAKTTYQNVISYRTSGNNVAVLLDNKHVGDIHKVQNGYQYFPKGQTDGGEIKKSLSEIKYMLENDPD
jgi:hypothetical protein